MMLLIQYWEISIWVFGLPILIGLIANIMGILGMIIFIFKNAKKEDNISTMLIKKYNISSKNGSSNTNNDKG